MPKKAATPQSSPRTKAPAAKTAPKGGRQVKDQPTQKAAKTAPAEAAAKKPAKTAKPTTTKGSGSATVAGTPPKAAQIKHREDSKTVVAKEADTVAAKKAPSPAKSKPKGDRSAFLASQRQLLLDERSSYISQAEALKAQADSLALEHEPGDVQFDEEGGEGGTANVDREIDLYLSGQARATVAEIDRALHKIEDGTYGLCESCGQPIPEARLEALPYAALCVTCKSGGLSSRR